MGLGWTEREPESTMKLLNVECPVCKTPLIIEGVGQDAGWRSTCTSQDKIGSFTITCGQCVGRRNLEEERKCPSTTLDRVAWKNEAVPYEPFSEETLNRWFRGFQEVADAS